MDSTSDKTLTQGRNALFLTVMNITNEEGHPLSMVEGAQPKNS